MEKLAMLRKLYYYKAFGFKYINENMLKDGSIKTSFLNVDSISNIKSQVLNCSLCTLCKSRKNALFSFGSKNAKVFFVSDSPSIADDLRGELFSGKSGKFFLDCLKKTIGDGEFYFSNIIKCKISGDEVPNIEYFQKCSPYIMQEIDIIAPKIIVTLGSLAFNLITNDFGESVNFDSLRGSVFKFKNTLLMPTYSPYWIITNPSKMDEFMLDLDKIKEFI
ncbi:uracil-DNA glycosylase, family 4 [Campylobacter sputorum subsp. sputorum]|nr:uracil-DNA glycosylase [Campylobacter sputorum]KAB0582713.1 hypothetical protein F7P64_00790 [Campylobacter sputorum subsp. sputorum]QEL05746.1 uracil-DNA glycosylase, family 4 [Campylobacter sputorum subsp. sputorum]